MKKIRKWEKVRVFNFPTQGKWVEENNKYSLYQYGGHLLVFSKQIKNYMEYVADIEKYSPELVRILNSNKKMRKMPEWRPHMSEWRALVKRFFKKDPSALEEAEGILFFYPQDSMATHFLYHLRDVRWKNWSGKILVKIEFLGPVCRPAVIDRIAQIPYPKSWLGESFELFICDCPCEIVTKEMLAYE